MKKDFGLRCWTMTVAVKGNTLPENCQKLIAGIIKGIGMNAIFEEKTWTYDGDLGHIMVQPLYESFIGFDIWVRHRGGYLTITSCHEFTEDKALAAIRRHGYAVTSNTPVAVLDL